MRRPARADILVVGLVALLYGCNRFLWSHHAAGVLGWFLRCYCNDVLAGLVLVAIANILLALGGWRRLPFWAGACLLLFCGVVWECLAPAMKPSAVFDPWDFLAYQCGGGIYFLLYRPKDKT